MEHQTHLLTLVKNDYSKQENISLDSSFEELEMNSFDIVDFIMSIEEMTGVVFEDHQILEFKTLRDVYDAMIQFSKED